MLLIAIRREPLFEFRDDLFLDRRRIGDDAAFFDIREFFEQFHPFEPFILRPKADIRHEIRTTCRFSHAIRRDKEVHEDLIGPDELDKLLGLTVWDVRLCAVFRLPDLEFLMDRQRFPQQFRRGAPQALRQRVPQKRVDVFR